MMSFIKRIKIKYFEPDLQPLEQHGNWIDLRSAIDLDTVKGGIYLIPLGIGMELPIGYEAIIAPRSSTMKNYGIIMTNSVGIVDTAYCGDNDQWHFPCYAIKEGHISKNDRIAQFRIIQSQPLIEFDTVDKLRAFDRGGFGSTGIQ